MFGLSIAQYRQKALLFSAFFAIPSFLFSIYDVYAPFKMVGLYVWLNLLLYFYLRINIGLTIGISTSAFCILNVVEFFFTLITSQAGKSLQQLAQIPAAPFILVWLYLALLAGMGYLLQRLRFDLRKLFPQTLHNRYLAVLVLIGSIELISILMMNANYLIELTNTPVPLGITRQLPYFHIVVLILFIVMIILFRIYLNLTINRVETQTQTPYLQNINDLITAIRSIKHDAVNHYTAINGLLKFGSYELATDYVKQLFHEASSIITVVDGVKNPSVSALLHSKMAICIANRISLSVSVTSVSQFHFMKSNDLVAMIGNLLDHAIRASLDEPEENRLIKVEWHDQGKKSSLLVEHTGSGEESVSLAVVKKIVERYKGKLHVSSEQGFTRFTIQF